MCRARCDDVLSLRRVTNMSIVDIRAARPLSHPQARRGGCNPVTADVVGDRTAPADRSSNVPRVLVLHSVYRKVHRDLSCVRVIAASAIVAGLLLGTAPMALAQVGQLLASVPAAFTQVEPISADLRPAAVDSPGEGASTHTIVQHRLETHSATSMISWNGTSGALRCSFGLLFEGSTRTCEAA
jgi:hypothetical protein